ncbi:hypothetical protein HZS_4916 [Henneguya salminicola]|nr:hypothetical protein HZS_4916 [Henneguya salminicola]
MFFLINKYHSNSIFFFIEHARGWHFKSVSLGLNNPPVGIINLAEGHYSCSPNNSVGISSTKLHEQPRTLLIRISRDHYFYTTRKQNKNICMTTVIGGTFLLAPLSNTIFKKASQNYHRFRSNIFQFGSKNKR